MRVTAGQIESAGAVRNALLNMGFTVEIKNSHICRVYSPGRDTGLSVVVMQSSQGCFYETALWSRSSQTIVYDQGRYEDVRQFETIDELIAEIRSVLLD